MEFPTAMSKLDTLGSRVRVEYRGFAPAARPLHVRGNSPLVTNCIRKLQHSRVIHNGVASFVHAAEEALTLLFDLRRYVNLPAGLAERVVTPQLEHVVRARRIETDTADELDWSQSGALSWARR